MHEVCYQRDGGEQSIIGEEMRREDRAEEWVMRSL